MARGIPRPGLPCVYARTGLAGLMCAYVLGCSPVFHPESSPSEQVVGVFISGGPWGSRLPANRGIPDWPEHWIGWGRGQPRLASVPRDVIEHDRSRPGRFGNRKPEHKVAATLTARARRMPALGGMRELETSLQQFGEFLLKARLVNEKAAPYCVRWVRRFLARSASNEPLADQVRQFCEELERNDGCQDWQVQQAEQALRIYFVNFLLRTDWHQPASTVVDENGRTNPLAARWARSSSRPVSANERAGDGRVVRRLARHDLADGRADLTLADAQPAAVARRITTTDPHAAGGGSSVPRRPDGEPGRGVVAGRGRAEVPERGSRAGVVLGVSQ